MPQAENAETKVAADEALPTATDKVASAHQKARHTLTTGNRGANVNLAGSWGRGHLIIDRQANGGHRRGTLVKKMRHLAKPKFWMETFPYVLGQFEARKPT